MVTCQHVETEADLTTLNAPAYNEKRTVRSVEETFVVHYTATAANVACRRTPPVLRAKKQSFHLLCKRLYVGDE